MCKNQKVLGADVQKDLNWMADSISRKPRGVRAKFWADLELILKAHGPRVEKGKTEGLFRKEPGLKGYLRAWTVGSRSVGSGRNGARDLILGVHTDRTARTCFGRGVAALLAGKQFPRRRHAELHRSSPILVLRGSFRPRFGSGVLDMVRLIHLSTHMGSGVP